MTNKDDLIIFTDKYFSFLVTDFGFNRTEKWVSYEFHIEYLKDNIEIDIAIEGDGTSVPWVAVTDHSKPADFDKTITPKNIYYLGSLEKDNQILKDIYSARNVRYNPMVDRFVKTYTGANNYDKAKKETFDDYQNIGRKEHENLVKEFADIIKRNKEILNGDLSKFPKREEPKEIKLDIYERTDTGVKKVKQKKFKLVDDFMKYIKDRHKT